MTSGGRPSAAGPGPWTSDAISAPAVSSLYVVVMAGNPPQRALTHKSSAPRPARQGRDEQDWRHGGQVALAGVAAGPRRGPARPWPGGAVDPQRGAAWPDRR